MKPRIHSILCSTLFATFSLVGISHAQIVVAGGNGNFEATTIGNLTNVATGIYQGGLTSLDGWAFSGGSVGTFRWLFDTAASVAPQNYGPVIGTYSLNLVQPNSDYANVASTTVTGLAAGQSYTLSFETAVRTGGSGTITVKVDGTSVGSFDQTVGTTYVTRSFDFTAADTSAVISLEYASTVNTNGYMLDNLAVAEATWTAGDGVWNGGGGADTKWSTAANWNVSTIAQGVDRSATFSSLTPVTATVDINRPIGALLFSGANHTLAAGTGSLTLDGDATYATPTVTVASGITAAIGATLNGSEGLFKNGSGTLSLTASNTYTGETTVDSGTLILGGNQTIKVGNTLTINPGTTVNLASASDAVRDLATITIDGGTLADTSAAALHNHAIFVSPGRTLNLFNGATVTAAGAGTGNASYGQLFLGSGNTVNVSGTPASTWNADIHWGGITTINIDSGATLINAGRLGNIEGMAWGLLNLTGEGTLVMTDGTGTLLETTVGANATLQIGDGGVTGDFPNSVVGSVINYGTVVFNRSNAYAPNPVITGSGAVIQNGAGVTTLSAINTYTGNTTVNAGTLELADDAQLRFVVTDSGSNQVTGAGTATFNGDFNIDTTAVTGTTGSPWLLVDRDSLTGESFESTFSVIGFTEQLDGVTWKMTDSTGTWTFSETTGELSLVAGSDYDTWGSTYGLAAGSEGGDLDNDGLTNFEEYAFGLIPNSGASVNPITSPLSKTSGVFKYTRRNTTEFTTGVNYSYESSTTLSGTWPSFTPVTAVSNNATPIEEITVTVPAALLAEPKLFIRVKAE